MNLQIDELIATVMSLQGITQTMPAQFVLYAEAVGKALRLYKSEDINKEDFLLVVSSLKQDVWGCVAFCEMSDELRIDWIMEKMKEVGGRY